MVEKGLSCTIAIIALASCCAATSPTEVIADLDLRHAADACAKFALESEPELASNSIELEAGKNKIFCSRAEYYEGSGISINSAGPYEFIDAEQWVIPLSVPSSWYIEQTFKLYITVGPAVFGSYPGDTESGSAGMMGSKRCVYDIFVLGPWPWSQITSIDPMHSKEVNDPSSTHSKDQRDVAVKFAELVASAAAERVIIESCESAQ